MLSLLAELLRGVRETIRETLPGDIAEERVFRAGFVLGLSVQLLGFTLLALLGGR